RSAGGSDDFRRLALAGERSDRKGRGGYAEAGEESDLVVDDEILRDALGVVGHRAVVLDDQLDLLAGNSVAMLRHIKLGSGGLLFAGRLLLAAHRQNQADFDVLRLRAADRAERRGGAGCGDKRPLSHYISSVRAARRPAYQHSACCLSRRRPASCGATKRAPYAAGRRFFPTCRARACTAGAA